MNHAGRPPKPTHLKVLQGTLRKHRKRNEPEPEIALPECPPHLEGEAKSEWESMSEQLFSLGLLTRIDKAALAGYCQAWADWVEAMHELKRGKVLRAKTGYPILSPWWSIANKANEQMRAYLTEFGLTPASRSRIDLKGPGKPTKNKFSNL
jgi:P27 family predicted phage terminase small subunit